MAADDPTVAAVLAIWGQSVTLERTPPVAFEGALLAPANTDPVIGAPAFGHDYVILARTADLAPLALQPGEVLYVGSVAYTVAHLRPDDGAGTNILVRRFA